MAEARAAAIRPIYTAASAEAAEAELLAFEQAPWVRKFHTVVAAWRRAWGKVIPFFVPRRPCARWSTPPTIQRSPAVSAGNATTARPVKHAL